MTDTPVPRPKSTEQSAEERREKRRASNRKWWAANRERVKAANRAWKAANQRKVRAQSQGQYAADPEKIRARSRTYYAANLEKEQARKRVYYAANSEEMLAGRATYRKANPEKFRAIYHTRRSRKLSAEGSFTADDIARIYKLQNGRCAYCRVKLGSKFDCDHIVPLAKGGSNWPSNIQLTCRSCNCQKNASDPIDFARRKGRLL